MTDGKIPAAKAASPQAETRVDPAQAPASPEKVRKKSGEVRNKSGKVRKSPEWNSVQALDPADGQAYTKEAFVECYGGTAEWDAAAHGDLKQAFRKD
eukprot:gene567-biopygen9010